MWGKEGGTVRGRDEGEREMKEGWRERRKEVVEMGRGRKREKGAPDHFCRSLFVQYHY